MSEAVLRHAFHPVEAVVAGGGVASMTVCALAGTAAKASASKPKHTPHRAPWHGKPSRGAAEVVMFALRLCALRPELVVHPRVLLMTDIGEGGGVGR